jgi:hypothetical protein
MIYRDIISRPPWKVKISRHAYVRALQRGIHSMDIESVIRCGRMKRFGKNHVRFMLDCREGAIICVGEKKTRNVIKILTIELG